MPICDPETQATTFGNNSQKVENRLRNASKMLISNYRQCFRKNASYHADKRMLISENQKLALVWSLRNKPDQPVGYQNQQPTVGIVKLIVIGGWEVDPNNYL